MDISSQHWEVFRSVCQQASKKFNVFKDDREDLAEFALQHVAKRFSEGRYVPEKGRVDQWAYPIAYNAILDYFRLEKRTPAPISDEAFAGRSTTGTEGKPEPLVKPRLWQRCRRELDRLIRQTHGEVEDASHRCSECGLHRADVALLTLQRLRRRITGCELPLPEPNAMESAVEWLTARLASGPMRQRDVYDHAADAGISHGTLRRAKIRLHVVSHRAGFQGSMFWSIPAQNEPSVKILRQYGERAA